MKYPYGDDRIKELLNYTDHVSELWYGTYFVEENLIYSWDKSYWW